MDCREEGTLLEFQLFADRPNQETEVDGLISNPPFIGIIHLSVLELCVPCVLCGFIIPIPPELI
jgi:hypothetical protein